MNQDLFTGNLVRLTTLDIEQVSEAESRWSRDSEYWRLQAGETYRPYSVQATKKLYEKYVKEDDPTMFAFIIRTIEDDRMIGEVGLDGIHWNHGDCFVGIGIGERKFWGKGYGTDAMNVILRYAFTELNLWRVSLNVFEYNPRAIHSYEKAGFVHEGRVRAALNRAGRRWDIIYMGITCQEWQSLHS